MKRTLITSAALCLVAATGCVSEEDSVATQQALQRENAPSSYMEIPILSVDSIDRTEGYAFGYSPADGWHWGQRINVSPLVVNPPPVGSALSFESLFKGADLDSLPGGLTLNASSGGSVYFSATLAGALGLNIPQSNLELPAQTPAAEGFSASLGAGSGGSCDLMQLCDLVDAVCAQEGGSCGSAAGQCRQQIYNVAIPSEVQPLVCALVDYAQCVSQIGGYADIYNQCLQSFLGTISIEYNDNRGMNPNETPAF